MREVSQLQGHVKYSQKLWKGQLVRHHICFPDLILFFSFLPCLIYNLVCYTLSRNHIEISKITVSKYSDICSDFCLYMHLSSIFEILGNKLTGW